jgi:hypothetical protein
LSLILSKALNIAHSKKTHIKDYAHLLKWLSGVVFMGTPHSGSDVAFWASLAAKLLSTASFGTSTNKGLLRLLCRDSAFLGSLSRRFAVENPQLPVLTFYELEKFAFLNCRVRCKSLVLAIYRLQLTVSDCGQGVGAA